MLAKHVYLENAWVAGEFEPPACLKNKPVLSVWRTEREFETGRIAMKIDRGAGVWDRSGQLLFHDGKIADLSFSGQGRLLSIENRVVPAGGEWQQAYRIQHREGKSFGVLGESVVTVPWGDLRYLIRSPVGDRCLVTWLDQSAWGYVSVVLPTMQQQGGGLRYPTSSVSPPAISPDGRCAVACSLIRSGWWTDDVDDFWDVPSPGGLWKLASISLDVFAEQTTTWHDLLVRLEPGWRPESYASTWDMAWGPEFIDDQRIRIWLPDGGEEILALPLLSRILVERPLRTSRSS